MFHNIVNWIFTFFAGIFEWLDSWYLFGDVSILGIIAVALIFSLLALFLIPRGKS